MAEPEKDRRRLQLWKRLPLLVAVGLGIWLWRGGGGFVAADRELVFRMPEDRAAIRRFEYQLYGSDNELLKREEFALPNGASENLVPEKKILLKDGVYTVKLFRWGEAGGPTAKSVRVELGREEQLPVDVPPASAVSDGG